MKVKISLRPRGVKRVKKSTLTLRNRSAIPLLFAIAKCIRIRLDLDRPAKTQTAEIRKLQKALRMCSMLLRQLRG